MYVKASFSTKCFALERLYERLFKSEGQTTNFPKVLTYPCDYARVQDSRRTLKSLLTQFICGTLSVQFVFSRTIRASTPVNLILCNLDKDNDQMKISYKQIGCHQSPSFLTISEKNKTKTDWSKSFTWPLVDTNFIFSCLTLYLTRSLHSLVRY